MEVYVDDMLVKSLEAEDHITHLNSTFQILRRYRMRLNPLKCSFGVASVLKTGKKFQWNEECEDAFQGLKRHLGQAPLLSKSKPGEILQLYLAVSNEAISSVLTREEGTTQLPVYYTRRLLKWAVELSEFNLVFKTRAAIKGQALSDFVVEFTNLPDVDEIMEPVEPPTWNLFMDGSAQATNYVAEYEALLAGLRLAREMKLKRLLISSDSQLIPRIENSHADALSKLASSKDSELLTVVPIEHLFLPSTETPNVMWVTGTPTWMQPIVAYLKDQRSFSSPLLRCVRGEEANYILREVHEGVCGNHSGGLSLAQKILRQGQPSQDLTTVSSPWPFSKWGVDLIGPLPKGRGGVSFAIVAIDYFTKWVEAELLAKITEANTSKFLWKNIICRFGIPYSIVSDNGRQFDNKKGAWVDELSQVLWAIRTTIRTLTGETPFLMAFETEAMIPVEVGLPSPRRLHFSEITNDELRRCDLGFIEERRDDSQLKLGTYQRKMTRYFNSKVKKRSFRINDLVLRRVFLSSKEPGSGSLDPN
ncbi:uncharacterized protein LOC111406817 [Olea europaea var. sylvestris]|uniref:uncharacterized protein LOC111406817 n=1 Tax=Olea europaea var. sylvestris TaxID=158386 RepID=UPI000C1D870B|nr:uncharacterized protein LOC111406817 [Olea europaea var. sylvestris]